jgi:hypothetical protein
MRDECAGRGGGLSMLSWEGEAGWLVMKGEVEYEYEYEHEYE